MPNNIPLTFKQYLASKETLREAIKNTPKQTVTYRITKYCKLVIGESKETKDYVSFKPKNIMQVEWLYEDIDNPEPIKITIDDQSNQEITTYWSGSKLMKWLNRNSIEEI